MKILTIYGICAVAIFLFGCAAATEKTGPDSKSELPISSQSSPTPLVTDSLLAIVRFREQPLVLEQLNRIFHTNKTEAKLKAARIFNLSKTEAARLVACDDGLSWRVIDPTDLKELRFGKDEDGVEPTVMIMMATPIETSRAPSLVGSDEAVAIAAVYFLRDTSQRFNADVNILGPYFPSVCTAGDYWRILFIPREFENIKRPADIASLTNAHPPNYLIDSRTGYIVFAQ